MPVPSQLTVSYKGRELTTNVSGITVYFWNDGKLPIKSEDILEPLGVQLDPTCEILDVRVLKVSRPVTGFSFSQAADSSKNLLPISFKILEQRDGAALQIIYAGPPAARLRIAGVIAGAGEPRRLADDESRFAPTTRRQNALRISWIGAAAGLVGSFLAGICSGFWSNSRKLPGGLRARILFFAILLVGVVAMVLGGYLEHSARAILRPGVPGPIWIQ